MSIFQLPPSRCPCKEFLISWFLPPNNLGGKKSVKFFWKCKFRVYNAVSSLGIGVRKRVTRYNWHGIKPHAVSICHFSRKAKNQLHARCHNNPLLTSNTIPPKTRNYFYSILVGLCMLVTLSNCCFRKDALINVFTKLNYIHEYKYKMFWTTAGNQKCLWL